MPKVLGFFDVLLELHQAQSLDDDDDPRCHRHDQQQDGHTARDKVALRPDVGNAELGFHETPEMTVYSRTKLTGTMFHMASRNTVAFTGHKAPALRRGQRCFVQAVKTAGLLDFDLLGQPVFVDQHAQQYLALLTHAAADGRVAGARIVQ